MKAEGPEDFHPGQRVWFHGLKAKVLSYRQIEDVCDSAFFLWGVPVKIKDRDEGVYLHFTIAHYEALIPRKKGEAWI